MRSINKKKIKNKTVTLKQRKIYSKCQKILGRLQTLSQMAAEWEKNMIKRFLKVFRNIGQSEITGLFMSVPCIVQLLAS